MLASTQCLDFTRNTNWLASRFSLKKETQLEIFFESVFRKFNCSGNQGVIAGVCILTQFHIFILNSLSAKSVLAGEKFVATYPIST
jgi:hypothetical protein